MVIQPEEVQSRILKILSWVNMGWGVLLSCKILGTVELNLELKYLTEEWILGVCADLFLCYIPFLFNRKY